MSNSSIVEYFGEHERYSCGYCSNSNTSYSHGLWGHCLNPEDYQDLIDRGWRRSGKYCYKPTLNLTCCPQYAIRCEALKFKLSKSQKKVLKRMHKFLAEGRSDNERSQTNCGSNQDVELRDHQMDFTDSPFTCSTLDDASLKLNDSSICQEGLKESPDEVEECNLTSHQANAETNESFGVSNKQKSKDNKTQGRDPDRPTCRKAKDIRRERRVQKLMKAGYTIEEASVFNKKQKCEEKTLENFLSEAFTTEPMHRLELRLVRCNKNDPAFSKTFGESFNVYKKYQTIIHKTPVEKSTEDQFTRFLVTNPFQLIGDDSSHSIRYGSYHQQYWLDNKLIAVGVIDILPFCVSSVYLYYDPEYSFLSLGTYASLREIAFTREIHRTYPDLVYYYMGFYIHSCPKMRYKSAFFPSYLLCPETYRFLSIEQSISKVEISKYSRLEEDTNKKDVDGVVNLREVMILYQRERMTYHIYHQLNKGSKDEEAVRQYAEFVGRKCYRRILLYRS